MVSLTESNQNNLIKEYEKLVNSSTFTNIKNVKKIVDCVEEIHKIISNNKINNENIQKLKILRVKLLKKANRKISNLFLKIFNFNEVKVLKEKLKSFNQDTKPINKLLGKVDPEYLSAYLGEYKERLSNILFKNHIYERMMHFGHPFELKDGKPVFNLSIKQDPVNFCHDCLKKIPENDKEWEKLRQNFIEKKVILQEKDELGDKRYPFRDMTEMTTEEFKNLLIVNDFWNSNITLTIVKTLTIEELCRYGILKREEGEKEEIVVDNNYTYGRNGFELLEKEWKNFTPYQYTNTPPEDYTVDIIVHSKPGFPNVFDVNAHASIRIKTPSGEIYSVGFYPNYEEDDLDAHLRIGSLRIPDEYEFMPSHSYEQHVMTYSLPNKENFHKLIKWIEDSQNSSREKSENPDLFPLLYHPTHHNCAFFADHVREKIIKLGATSQNLSIRKISNWTRLGIKIKQGLLQLLIASPLGRLVFKFGQGTEYKGKTISSVMDLEKKKFYLPVDVLLKYEKTMIKTDAAVIGRNSKSL